MAVLLVLISSTKGENDNLSPALQNQRKNMKNPIQLAAMSYKTIAKNAKEKDVFDNALQTGCYNDKGMDFLLEKKNASYFCINGSKIPIAIEKKLGFGGFGQVYKAKFSKNKYDKALKYVKLNSTNFPLVSREVNFLACLRNAKYVARMDTCVIVPYQNLTKDIVIVMPVFERSALEMVYNNSESDRMHEYVDHRKHMTSTKKFKIAFLQKIALGIQEVHGRGIIHRDLKLENILIDDKNEPYISDFGLSMFKSSRDTQDVGTDIYKAPELEKFRYSEKSDIFALGLIFYSIIIDRGPHYFVQMKEDMPFKKTIAHHDLGREYSYLQPLIEQMLQPKPESRPNIKQVLCILDSPKPNINRCFNGLGSADDRSVFQVLNASELEALKKAEDEKYLEYAVKTNEALKRYVNMATDPNNKYYKIAEQHKKNNVMLQAKAARKQARIIIL